MSTDSTKRPDVMQEITQVVMVGAIGLGVLFVTAGQIVKLWPRFIERVETDLMRGIYAAFRDATSREQGH
jgi:hypothetical protein